MTQNEPERYGNVRITKIKAAYDDLRRAVRAHDMEAAEDALDRYEQWADYVFGARTEDKVMDDLVKRLRDVNHGWPPDVCLEAADRIEAQATEIARLRDALEAERASHKITLDRESAAYVRHDARAEAAEAVQEAVARAALEAAAQTAETRWHKWNEYEPPLVECDASACEEIASAIRAIDPDQIVKEVRRMLRPHRTLEAEATHLRAVIEAYQEMAPAQEPGLFQQHLAKRRALKEPKT